MALKVDPRCDLAYMHLAQMYVQKGKFNEALDVYGKALELAKSPVDLENVTMGMEAAKAQMVALERLNAERSK